MRCDEETKATRRQQDFAEFGRADDTESGGAGRFVGRRGGGGGGGGGGRDRIAYSRAEF